MDRQTFTTRFPNYCRTCQGWGILKNPPRVADCECLRAGICPRCATKLENYRCPDCGWNADDQIRGIDSPQVI